MEQRTKLAIAAAVAVTAVIAGLSGAFDDEQPTAAGPPPSAAPENTPRPSRPAPDPGYVTADDITPWPLTVTSGTLACDDQAVTFTTGENTYGLNGTAEDAGHPPVDPVWAEDEDTAAKLEEATAGTGTVQKVSLAALIDRGLDLC